MIVKNNAYMLQQIYIFHVEITLFDEKFSLMSKLWQEILSDEGITLAVGVPSIQHIFMEISLRKAVLALQNSKISVVTIILRRCQ